jgi:hypothetical protein
MVKWRKYKKSFWWSKTEEKERCFLNKELFFFEDGHDTMEYYDIGYELKFNYKTTETLTIVYDIDIELVDGENYNIKEPAIY